MRLNPRVLWLFVSSPSAKNVRKRRREYGRVGKVIAEREGDDKDEPEGNGDWIFCQILFLTSVIVSPSACLLIEQSARSWLFPTPGSSSLSLTFSLYIGVCLPRFAIFFCSESDKNMQNLKLSLSCACFKKRERRKKARNLYKFRTRVLTAKQLRIYTYFAPGSEGGRRDSPFQHIPLNFGATSRPSLTFG